MMDDIWQCRHSREGCDTDTECYERDHGPIDDKEWDDYVNDLESLKAWNEGMRG